MPRVSRPFALPDSATTSSGLLSSAISSVNRVWPPGSRNVMLGMPGTAVKTMRSLPLRSTILSVSDLILRWRLGHGPGDHDGPDCQGKDAPQPPVAALGSIRFRRSSICFSYAVFSGISGLLSDPNHGSILALRRMKPTFVV